MASVVVVLSSDVREGWLALQLSVKADADGADSDMLRTYDGDPLHQRTTIVYAGTKDLEVSNCPSVRAFDVRNNAAPVELLASAAHTFRAVCSDAAVALERAIDAALLAKTKNQLVPAATSLLVLPLTTDATTAQRKAYDSARACAKEEGFGVVELGEHEGWSTVRHFHELFGSATRCPPRRVPRTVQLPSTLSACSIERSEVLNVEGTVSMSSSGMCSFVPQDPSKASEVWLLLRNVPQTFARPSTWHGSSQLDAVAYYNAAVNAAGETERRSLAKLLPTASPWGSLPPPPPLVRVAHTTNLLPHIAQ